MSKCLGLYQWNALSSRTCQIYKISPNAQTKQNKTKHTFINIKIQSFRRISPFDIALVEKENKARTVLVSSTLRLINQQIYQIGNTLCKRNGQKQSSPPPPKKRRYKCITVFTNAIVGTCCAYHRPTIIS